MIIPWEGDLLKCLKWLSYFDYNGFIYNFIFTFSRASNKLKSFQGTHNIDIISLVGFLLSSSYLEKREHGGIRVIFIKYSNNVELLWDLYMHESMLYKI